MDRYISQVTFSNKAAQNIQFKKSSSINSYNDTNIKTPQERVEEFSPINFEEAQRKNIIWSRLKKA